MDELRKKIIDATAKIANDLVTVKCSVHSNDAEGRAAHCRLCTALYDIGSEVLGLEMETRLDQQAEELSLSRFPGETDDNLRERMKRQRIDTHVRSVLDHLNRDTMSPQQADTLKKQFKESIAKVSHSWVYPIATIPGTLAWIQPYMNTAIEAIEALVDQMPVAAFGPMADAVRQMESAAIALNTAIDAAARPKFKFFKADSYQPVYELPEGERTYIAGRFPPEGEDLVDAIEYALFRGKADFTSPPETVDFVPLSFEVVSKNMVAAAQQAIPDPDATPPARPSKSVLDSLLKALEAGNYNAAPAPLSQGTGSCIPDGPTEKKADVCECGAFKSSGAKKGDKMHSSWCPWSKA